MQRYIQNLNADWLYIPQNFKAAAKKVCPEAKFVSVCLPHTNVELPYHNFSEQEYCFISWYRKHFDVPKIAKGRRVFIDFDGVMLAATVFVNGKQAGPEHKGGYTPFSYDITDLVQVGKRNVLSVRVDSTERNDIPPFGNVVDYMTFGGIYRDVHLRIVDSVYIESIFARTGEFWEETKRVTITAKIVNTTDSDQTVKLAMQLNDPVKGGKTWNAKPVEAVVPANGSLSVDSSLAELENIVLWDLDNPKLYNVTVSLVDDKNKKNSGDSVSTRIGFRSMGFSDDGWFYLNGKPMKLRGLNRHQTFPYIGQAAPARMQRKDADILKYDLACTVVRTSHYAQSPHFLDRCDEIGLLVLEEMTGWQHLGDDAWKQVSLGEIREMIERDRNHPSICLWCVRVDESRDDHDFYTATNALARELDPTRQTGGIRDKRKSELLEDVYTLNDFAYDLGEPEAPRYMNTEFCGHMYPTKSFDQEERVKQHALHHAHVHNQVCNPSYASAGAIGWCAFDYNTHNIFGSGDRICYHGVMDIFRQPKFAAMFYASQEDPAKKIVLDIAAYWKMGDKNGGGAEPVIIFSNVDEIEIIVGEESRGRYKPDWQAYPHLPRPPFICTGIGGTWGGQWLPLMVKGYINGELVATRQISNDGVPQRLEMTADDATLNADGSDVTRISLRITDEFGNILPFSMIPVTLKITGPGTLIGENPFSMPGGRGAVYVRAGKRPGTITVTADAARLGKKKVTIKTRVS